MFNAAAPRLITASLVLSGVLAGTGIAAVYGGGSNSGSARLADGHTAELAKAHVVEHLRARRDASADLFIERNLADLLPNQEFRIEDSRPDTLAAGVLAGEVVKVERGAGYFVEGDASRGTVIDFDDPRVQWKTVELTVEQSDAVGEIPESVRIGLTIDGEFPASEVELALLGQQIVAPIKQDQFFSHDAELWSIAQGGDLLGFVEDGVFDFPILGEESDAFVGDLTTLDSLEEEAREDKPVVFVEYRNGFTYSTD